jgi:hypothetical protein
MEAMSMNANQHQPKRLLPGQLAHLFQTQTPARNINDAVEYMVMWLKRLLIESRKCSLMMEKFVLLHLTFHALNKPLPLFLPGSVSPLFHSSVNKRVKGSRMLMQPHWLMKKQLRMSLVIPIGRRGRRIWGEREARCWECQTSVVFVGENLPKNYHNCLWGVHEKIKGLLGTTVTKDSIAWTVIEEYHSDELPDSNSKFVEV